MIGWLAGCVLPSVYTSVFEQMECFDQSNRKLPEVESQALEGPLW